MKYRGLSSIRWMYMKGELKRKKMDKEKDMVQEMEALKITPRKGSDYLSSEALKINDAIDDCIEIAKKHIKQNKDE